MVDSRGWLSKVILRFVAIPQTLLAWVVNLMGDPNAPWESASGRDSSSRTVRSCLLPPPPSLKKALARKAREVRFWLLVY